MATVEWLRKSFNSEIRHLWNEWLANIPKEEQSRPWHGRLNAQLRDRWSGAKDRDDANYGPDVKKWIEIGPTHDDLLGDGADQFRMFCEHVGVDYDTLMSEPPTGRREVFKRRLSGKMAQYKKQTGRSMKALSEHLGWSEIDYQWLRRIKSNGADHARTKKDLLEQLANELDTTVDYLFGVTEAVELPTWETIIELGIKEFVSNQPAGSEFSTEERVRNFLVSRR